MSKKGEWIRVRRSLRCPICDRPDWCVISADGASVICMRVAEGSVSEVTSKIGLGYLHHLNGQPRPVPLPQRPAEAPILDWTEKAKQHFLHPSAATARERIAAHLGVSVAALEQLGVGYGFDEYRNVELTTWPSFDEKRQVLGISRRYFSPVQVNGQWKNKLGWKAAAWGSTTLAGGAAARARSFLPEGGSDVAAMLTMGLRAIGRPSNTGGIRLLSRLLRRFREPIVVLAELDRRTPESAKKCSGRKCSGCAECWPGIFGARHTSEMLSAELQRPVFYCAIPGKDVREWLATNGNNGQKFVELCRREVKARQQRKRSC